MFFYNNLILSLKNITGWIYNTNPNAKSATGIRTTNHATGVPADGIVGTVVPWVVGVGVLVLFTTIIISVGVGPFVYVGYGV